MATLAGNHVLLLDGTKTLDRSLIGGKAWSIARMASLGLKVPPAFVISTAACVEYLATGDFSTTLENDIKQAVKWLETQSGRRFGAGPRPLLVSVRSGSAISMPGMMDTVLNLGINDDTEALLAAECADPIFARDTHRRFLELYARIVLKAECEDLAANDDPSKWRAIIAETAGGPIPSDVEGQLKSAVRAVFESWNSRRARRYRDHNNISHDLGTAVTIQAMVFGNLDDRSGTGVLFSRDPLTGEDVPYGEFLARAQGEDVVSGKCTPLPLSAMGELLNGPMQELLEAARMLERTDRDIQDIEFTVEAGQLYLLQSRTAKRSPRAAVKIAVDMVKEGLINPDEAISRISAEQVRLLLSPRLSPSVQESATPVAQGEAACPGVGIGVVVGSSDEAEARARSGEAVVLARSTTSPDDLHGMIAAQAILTEQGGSTSHAAVVARALGRPCVVGCGSGMIDSLIGKTVTVDGQSGKVYLDSLPVITPHEDNDEALNQISRWATTRTPVRIVAGAQDVSGVISFDEKVEEAEALFASLPPGATVSGRLFANDDKAVYAAVAAGVSVIVTTPVLPALLAAAQAAGPSLKVGT